jgi:hypothetical protein
MLSLIGCFKDNSAEVFTKKNVVANRQMQVRAFDTSKRTELLSACIGVLQDLGYKIEDTNVKLGVISGSKLRETDNTGEKASLLALSILSAMAGNHNSDYVSKADSKQNIKVSLVVNKISASRLSVRATFQRVVWNVAGEVKRLETLNDPVLYQGFFEKLSKAMFLEAHEL